MNSYLMTLIKLASLRSIVLLPMAAMVLFTVGQVGCRNRALDAVEDLQPAAEQRNRELEALTAPASPEGQGRAQ